MNKIFKNQKGSAMQVAIISILLIGIFTSSVTSMVINQTKSNIKSSGNADLKYQSEKGIEESIAKFIESIRLEGDKKSTLENFNILKEYIYLAETSQGNSGVVTASINDILKKAEDGTLQESHMKTLYDDIGDTIGKTSSNIAGKRILRIAQDYALFLKNNFFNEDGYLDTTQIEKSTVEDFIQMIANNLTKEKYPTTPEDKKDVGYDNDNPKYMGSIGASYFEVSYNNSEYSKTDYLGSIHNLFFGTSNITDDIEKISTLSEAKIRTIINKIEEAEYEDKEKKINLEIGNIDTKASYINEGDLTGYYKGGIIAGTKNIKGIVRQRLKIADLEIEMLKQALMHLLDSAPGGDSATNPNILYQLIVNAPKTITESIDNNTRNINVNNYKIDGKSVKYIDDTMKFNVAIPGRKAQIILYPEIESEVRDENKGNYKIVSTVKVKIHNILSKDKYEIDYEIVDWKKVNIN